MARSAASTPRHADPADLRRALETADFLAGLVEVAALNRRRAIARAEALPVVIVAGFLGAGKTTLMRHLLTVNRGLKIAAVVNDFAALNIDEALISDVSDDTTALANGCICCSLSGGVARSLAEIAARSAPVDAVLVEASGVSDPAGIAQIAGTVDGVALDCIVTVVDASQAPGRDWDLLIERQVRPANLILLNKADLVEARVLDDRARRLAALAPKARILRTIDCAVPPVVIFESASEPLAAADGARPIEDDGFATLVLTADEPVDRDRLEDALKRLPDGVLRIKGFLRLSGEPHADALLQGVGRRWTWRRAPRPQPASRLVVIGRSDALAARETMNLFKGAGLETAGVVD